MTTAAYREQRCTCAGGLELYCRVYERQAGGTSAAPAVTVLCLPGLTRNGRDFEALAPHLAARHRVICPDLRGRGLSARDPQWRNGGLLGMMLGAAVPQRVAGLVLNDIHGALSDILSAGTVERMQREKPDLERVTVGNRGHVPLLDEPEALTATDGFLACLGS